jgi:hypothetical protein
MNHYPEVVTNENLKALTHFCTRLFESLPYRRDYRNRLNIPLVASSAQHGFVTLSYGATLAVAGPSEITNREAF